MDRTLLAVFLAIYPIAVLFGTFLAGSRTTSSVVPNIIVLGIGFACLYLVAEELMAVRRIELGPSGVGFRFFIHTEHRLWTDLEPSRVAVEHQGWYVLSRYNNGKRVSQRGYRLSVEQARALLTYPACPEWTLPSSVASSLGISPPPT
ncbi:MAG: hypothetical protein WBF81_03455 [Thermoplasmata archaeon]